MSGTTFEELSCLQGILEVSFAGSLVLFLSIFTELRCLDINPI